jgi:GNAT superfamily N-acetyltransferase
MRQPHHDLAVTPADAGAAHRAFVTLPYRLYRADRNWVPPLRIEERQRWSPRHNHSLRTRWVRRFVAWRGGIPVGRIAAIEDPGFRTRWEADTGWFGFFECADDVAAARALLTAAGTALCARGATRMLGPINLTTHDETGVLVAGFDAPPTVITPYNPLYYPTLFAACGLETVREYHSYDGPLASSLPPALGRLMRAANRGVGFLRDVRLRPVDLTRWEVEARVMMTLYNAAFADVWGFVPITWEEFRERAARMRPFIVPELSPIAELDGRPIGFALTLPDINVPLARAHGRLLPLGWWHIARGIRHVRAARFILLGVAPAYRARGIGALIAWHVREAARRLGYAHLELSLVQGTNDRVRHVIEAFDCPVRKTYRLYAGSLATMAAALEVHAA